MLLTQIQASLRRILINIISNNTRWRIIALYQDLSRRMTILSEIGTTNHSTLNQTFLKHLWKRDLRDLHWKISFMLGEITCRILEGLSNLGLRLRKFSGLIWLFWRLQTSRIIFSTDKIFETFSWPCFKGNQACKLCIK
jgi:hypothetical protein